MVEDGLGVPGPHWLSTGSTVQYAAMYFQRDTEFTCAQAGRLESIS